MEERSVRPLVLAAEQRVHVQSIHFIQPSMLCWLLCATLSSRPRVDRRVCRSPVHVLSLSLSLSLRLEHLCDVGIAASLSALSVSARRHTTLPPPTWQLCEGGSGVGRAWSQN